MPDDPTSAGDTPAASGAEMAKRALAAARAAADAKRLEHERGAAARRRAETRAVNARPRDRDAAEPTAFGAAIEELLADRGWSGDATVAAVTSNWEQTVGPELAAHCQPVSLRSGVLTISAESTAWATQIRLLQRQLVARIDETAGVGVVRSIVVQGPTGPSWSHGPRRVPGPGPRDTYG